MTINNNNGSEGSSQPRVGVCWWLLNTVNPVLLMRSGILKAFQNSGSPTGWTVGTSKYLLTLTTAFGQKLFHCENPVNHYNYIDWETSTAFTSNRLIHIPLQQSCSLYCSSSIRSTPNTHKLQNWLIGLYGYSTQRKITTETITLDIVLIILPAPNGQHCTSPIG